MTPERVRALSSLREVLVVFRATHKKWHEIVQHGGDILSSLVNHNIEIMHLEGPNWGALAPFDEVRELVVSHAKQQTKELEVALQRSFDDLFKLYQKLQNAWLQLKYMADLTADTLTAMAHPTITFKTLSLDRLVAMVGEVFAMYTKDITLRKAVLEDIPTQRDRSVFMAYVASWTTPPFLDNEKIGAVIEALVYEVE